MKIKLSYPILTPKELSLALTYGGLKESRVINFIAWAMGIISKQLK